MLYGLLLLGLAAALFRVWHLTKALRQCKQAEARQRASEQRYEAIAKAIPTGIFYSDAAGQCSYVNEYWCEITGHTPEMAAEGGWQQTMYPEDRPTVSAEWAQAVQENRAAQMEYRVQRPDGTVRWVYGQTAVAERDASGQVVGYVGTLADINPRKCSEQALQQSEAHYQALVNVLPDLVMRLSREGVFLEFLASPSFRVLGEPADWIGTHVSETLPPALAQERLRVIEAVLRTRTMQVYEQDFLVEGEIQVEEVRVVPYGEDEVLFLVRDMSDRQRAEQALRRSEAQSQAILAAIPDYLVRLGADGIYRELAVPERDFALVSPTGLAGRSIDEVLPAELVSQRRHYLQKALQTGELQIYEQTVQVGDRSQEEEIRVVQSGPDEALFIIRDIGDRKCAERTLQRQLQQAQALSQVIQAIRNSLDLSTIFTTAVVEAAQLLPGLNCVVTRYYCEQSLWEIVAQGGANPNPANRVGFQISDLNNPFAARLKQGQIVQVEDTHQITDSTNQAIALITPGAWLLIPLVVVDQVWGSFTLSVPSHGYRWEDKLVSLAQAIANQLEVAIQQALLYQQVEQEKQKLLTSQAALRQAQQIAHLGNWEIDVATQSMIWSDNLFQIFGLNSARGEPSFTDFMSFIRAADRPRLEQAIIRTITGGIPYEIDLSILRSDGSAGYIESRAEAMRNDQGQIVKVFGTCLDISDRKQAEATIQKKEKRFRNIAANVPGVIIQYVLYADGSDEITYVSSGCYDLWELTPEESVANSQVLWNLIHVEDRVSMRASIAVSAQTLEPWKCQYRIVTPSGCAKWLEAIGHPERHDSGDVVWDTLVLDVSDRIRMEKQLEHDALHDGLTGLPNRALLLERLALALKRIARFPDYQFAVLFLDLDNFKVINDSLGHLAGDELLLKVSGLLADIIRETDLAARLGGDEFVILLDGLEDTQEAERVAERIMTLLQAPFQVSGHEVFIGTSIGIVVSTDHYQNAEELLRDSDLAMYRAKHSGRGRYAVFEPAMHLRVVQRLQMENDLRKALENNELVLYYQPIVYLLNTEAIQGFEALIRWQHPTRGLLLPEEFVEMAEETGLIDPIGEWILESACQQLGQWQTQFPGLFLSLNLSVKQLKPSLLQQLKRMLTTYRIQTHSLSLEITESMLVQNFDDTVELLEEIKEQKVCISIDDFGTGYSSLSYLHRLPVDILKIDRAFISPAAPGNRNQSITESIITLSDLLALKVIAEGVETAQQLAWLRRLGCELGQGCFFSPPVSAEQATQLLIQKG